MNVSIFPVGHYGLAGVLVAATMIGGGFSAAEIPGPPAPAPEGHRWVLNDALSDEFDGVRLDERKWNNPFRGWKGRVPGLFVPEAVSVQDGELQIRVGVLDPPRGDQGQWTVQCGAIQSKRPNAHYGYYEARIKASGTSTSTTFWLKKRRDRKDPQSKSTELDILECVGGAQRFAAFGDHMLSNTHLEYAPQPGVAKEDAVIKKGGRSPVGGRVADDFHTYGCWWVNPTTMRFFLDGKEVHTIELPTDQDPAPMNQPMFMNLVCETYAWEVPPTPESLRDPALNVARYDYVRVWTLVREVK